MDLMLNGKRALVTGSSSGVGAAIAQKLAAEGCEVVIHGRDPQRLHKAAEELRQAGATIHEVTGDLTTTQGAQSVCDQALTTGAIDILIANAGPFAEHTPLEATDDDWNTALAGNLMSAVRCIRALVPPMREQGWGRIITIGTRAVATPLVNMAEYSAAKAALVNYTGALAQELAGSGITANSISPGVILTDGLRTMFEQRAADEGIHRSWGDMEADVTSDYAPNPTGRLGRPDDIAQAAAFLASPLANYINAAVIRVDGGITPSINP